MTRERELELATALRAMRAAYGRLHDGLSDMIEGGRLTAGAIPDDYRWLVEALAGECQAADRTAELALGDDRG